ncbi:MAG: ABC transporter permease DevC [Waterburya sp.]
MLLSIPLAWLQLIHQKIRFLATLAGITFVVVLLFMQLGFQDALFESAVRVHNALKGDLFIVSSQYKSLTAQQNFPRSRLYQIPAFKGVESVSPLYFQFGKLKNIENGQKYSIFVMGIDPGKPTFKLPEINQSVNKLTIPDVALFDRDSRPEFGPIVQQFAQKQEVELEITSFNEIKLAKKFKVRSLFSLGPSFGVDGNLITNYSTFLDVFTDRNADLIDLGIIILKPNANQQEVQANLVANLPQDVQVIAPTELIALEKKYWDLRTPIGFIFKIMVFMGFIVGVGITYQVLYSNISTHLVAYATLKAIGFTDNYLLKAVFQQAFILAVLGYLPGIFLSILLYSIAKNATHLPVIMTGNKVIEVFISIFLMCTISGALAVQKLRSVDPAEIF